MTTISTTYARIAIILLALNFVFTGYAITKLASLSDPQPLAEERTAPPTEESTEESTEDAQPPAE